MNRFLYAEELPFFSLLLIFPQIEAILSHFILFGKQNFYSFLLENNGAIILQAIPMLNKKEEAMIRHFHFFI